MSASPDRKQSPRSKSRSQGKRSCAQTGDLLRIELSRTDVQKLHDHLAFASGIVHAQGFHLVSVSLLSLAYQLGQLLHPETKSPSACPASSREPTRGEARDRSSRVGRPVKSEPVAQPARDRHPRRWFTARSRLAGSIPQLLETAHSLAETFFGPSLQLL